MRCKCGDYTRNKNGVCEQCNARFRLEELLVAHLTAREKPAERQNVKRRIKRRIT